MHFISSVNPESVDATWILLKLLWNPIKKTSVNEDMLSSLLIKLTLKPPFCQSSFLYSWTIAVRSQQVLLMEFTVRKTLLYILGNNLFCCLKRRDYWQQINQGSLHLGWQLYIIIGSYYHKMLVKDLLWWWDDSLQLLPHAGIPSNALKYSVGYCSLSQLSKSCFEDCHGTVCTLSILVI